MVHLTNDAVQMKDHEYGKFESANKISYDDFDLYLQKYYNVNFYEEILPKIKNLVADIFEACGPSLYRTTKK